MTKNTEPSVIEQELTRLEQQVDALLTTIDRLAKENRSLRTQQELLATERAALLEKHDLVHHRVEGIVTRLKSLETGA
jgi:cell division protein ZapB